MGKAEDKVLGDELGRLTRLGFTSLAECLLSVPSSYLDLTRPQSTISARDIGRRLYAMLTVLHKTALGPNGTETWQWKEAVRVQLELEDAVGARLGVMIFGNVWPWRGTQPGEVVHLYGQVAQFHGKLVLNDVEQIAPSERGRVLPRYTGKRGQVKGELLADGVNRARDRVEDGERLLLAQAGLREEEFKKQTGLESAGTLLMHLHWPQSLEQGERAKKVARTLSAEALVRRAAFARVRRPLPESSIPIQKHRVEELIAALPHPLTPDQRTAVDDIVKDLRSGYPMRRLLSGDVGTGKSLAFMVPAVAAHEAGANVAILAPSQLVVAQLAREMRAFFPGTVVSEVFAGDKLGKGVVIGTTALLKAAEKAGQSFHFVVTDEEHKFSVGQKTGLVVEGTNVLEATATAIPRTLALVNFGGMDVSLLRKSPVARKVTTRITRDKDRPRLARFFDAVLERKGQIAVIYPFVKEDKGAGEGESLATVLAASERWEERFPGRVGTLHGNMTSEEKTGVIERLQAGQVDILITSVVIEVGVTLPSLKAMLIVQPDRYGVSQIHQLRGRLSRKGGVGYLFLHLAKEVEVDAMRRLELLVECSDGFTLAERDMDLRGFGDVGESGDSQTGKVRTLFFGIQLTHKEIEEASRRLGVL